MRAFAVLVALFASLVSGCSSTTTLTPDGGPAPIDGDAAAPAADPPADASDAGPASEDGGADTGSEAASGACIVKRAADFAACAEECGARLTLPRGGVYCSTSCETTKDCAALGGDLICPETIGACVPRCAGNASCTAGGFQRCDTETGGCDTL